MPEKRYIWEAMVDDSEIGNLGFPMVLVQIPLFNEKEVYKLSIGAACNLSWPADRILIQVMDGSTDTVIKDMVEKECARWACGVNIRYQVRETRGGFKAGALKEGLTYEYVRDCEHVAIFDADFNPNRIFCGGQFHFSFTTRTLHLYKPAGVNADECLLTRLQEISMDYHFTAEQEVGSSAHAFFGFNGSGGIWRIGAIKEAGGWDARTTAEDMDLAVRAGLKGWKLVYVGTLQVKSELPSTYKAFRSQQHRWFCGPTNLFRKIAMDIAKCKSAMSFHLTKAIFMGLLGTKSVNEWVVTEKLGDASKIEANGESDAPKESRFKVLRDRSGYGSETETLRERFCAGSGSWKWGCNKYYCQSWELRCFFSSVDAMAFSTETITISFTYFFKPSHLQLWDLASLVKYSQAIRSRNKSV
ncbi:hypothetical protein DH2020_027808 [Rehmannia glutinosa]|uniref:Glycosyltransferase 2-like domain-containing protein n=1 Tax=Rehmannia glutinosa TaxID=99300 RepID=A0ABR0VT34_REHGL